MATTALDVANEALTILGAQPVASLDAATFPETLLKSAYAIVAKETQVSYPWAELVTLATIEPDTTERDDGLAEFAIPTGCLRVRRVLTSFPFVDLERSWRIEGDKLVTPQAESIRVEYVAHQADPAQWSPMLLRVVYHALAAKTCMAIVQNERLYAELTRTLHEQVIPEARRVQAFVRSSPVKREHKHSWYNARRWHRG